MYKVKVNDKRESEIEIRGQHVSVNGTAVSWDQIDSSTNRYHILKNHRSYVCEVVYADRQKKNLGIKVNGKILRVTIRDRFDELLHQLGMGV